MLLNHLIAKTRPLANPKNVVLFNNYRITVLSQRLFRIENDPTLKFCDFATQNVWFRDMQKNQFSVKKEKLFCKIKTSYLSLYLYNDFKKSYVTFNDGKNVKIDNRQNLLGTYRTLDRCEGNICFRFTHEGTFIDGKVELDYGVCSKNGVAVMDDSNSLLLGENGEIFARENAETDIYVFAFKNEYREAIKSLYMIGGAPPVLPRETLGNFWSKYWHYSESSYIALMNKFKENHIPLSVATIDMDWHYSTTLDEDKKITELGRDGDFYGGKRGWTGYSWNTKLFPDYKRFLKSLHDQNLAVTLNLHPADGIRWFEDCYKEMAIAMGINPQTFEKVEFDITNTQFINNYFKIVHNPYEKDGVDFWWIDWQQGYKTKLDGLDPLWALNHYHYLDIKNNSNVPVILSRYCGAGAWRYPIGFSGDALISWKTLKYMPYFTATATNIGFVWWSHDIGGHGHGSLDFELFVRFAQFGVFSPINRLHCSDYAILTKEPWYYKNGSGQIVANYLRLRKQLVPFLFSMGYNTNKFGKALVEPLYYAYPNDEMAYEYKNQYLFGDLLVCPIYTKMKKDGFARQKVYFPEGEWTDIFTGEKYHGNKTYTIMRELDYIPVFAKSGTILPLDADDISNGTKLPEHLLVKIYDGNGTFTLTEAKKDLVCQTVFSCVRNGDSLKVSMKIGKNKKILPKNRKISFIFPDVSADSLELPLVFDKVVAKEVFKDDLTIELNGVVEIKEYSFSIKTKYVDTLNYLKNNATHVLNSIECKNAYRQLCYDAYVKSNNVDEFVDAVNRSDIPPFAKQKVLETV